MGKNYSALHVETRSEPGKAHSDKAAQRPGESSQEFNEDFAHVDLELGLVVVCDGASNPPGGKSAANTAAKAFSKIIGMYPIPDSKDNQTIGKRLLEAIRYAHQKVREQANLKSSQAYPGSSTTLTAAWIIDRHLYYAHVGDCRIYVLRNGALYKTPLTRDHTVAADLGITDPERIKRSAGGNVLTQAVGHAVTQPELKVMELTEQDLILICSDGLVKALNVDEIEAELRFGKSLKLKADSLISKAISKGARDDVTVALIAPPQSIAGTATSTVISPDFKVSILQEMDFFKSLDFSEVQTLNGIGETRILKSKETLMKEGAPADSFWVILRGEVEIVENDQGVESYGVGTCLGEGALFHESQTRMSTVRASSELTALVIDREDWLKLIERDDILARKVFERAALTLSKKLNLSHHKFVAKNKFTKAG